MTKQTYVRKLKALNKRLNAYAEQKINAAYADGFNAAREKAARLCQELYCGEETDPLAKAIRQLTPK